MNRLHQSVRWNTSDLQITVGLALLAGATRLWMSSGLGLNHFDEGGYAVSSLALANGDMPRGFLPLQHYLAPPVFYGLSALVMKNLGTSSPFVLLAISMTFGVATVLLVYAIGRGWIGRPGALFAAVCVALSDYHILYSRAGLTDILFVFVLLLALWLYALADDRRSLPFAALAGLATGLAWNTKYHGWLAGFIAGVALVPLMMNWHTRQFRRKVLLVAFAAVVACISYVPWYLYVSEEAGGYAALAKEHAAFMRPDRAITHVWRHIGTQRSMDGWLSRLAAPVGLLAAVSVYSGFRQRRPSTVGLAAGFLLLAGIGVGETLLVGLLAFCALPRLMRRRDVSGRFLLAFFSVFTLLTPMYHAYPRLLLPWFVAACLAAGLTVQGWLEARIQLTTKRIAAGTAVLLASVVICAIASSGGIGAAHTYRPSNRFESASREIATLAGDLRPITVIGEPAVVFYLRREGTYAWHVNNLNDIAKHAEPNHPFVLVSGRYGRVGGELRRLNELYPGAVELVGSVAADVNDVRIFDDFTPRVASEYRRSGGTDYNFDVMKVTLPAQFFEEQR